MTVRFVENGGQYHFSNPAPAGIWFAENFNHGVVSTAPVGRSSTYAYESSSQGVATTSRLAGDWPAMIAGYAVYSQGVIGSSIVIAFKNGFNAQCELRSNSTGQLYFTRNNVNLGAGNPTISSNTLILSAWNYIEFKAIFGTASNGTCEVKVNGIVWLTLTGITNATTVSTADSVQYGSYGGTSQMMDFYALDTGTGANTTYLGDITVASTYPISAGANSAWTVSQAPFALTGTGTLTSGTSLVYNGTITNGTTPTNAWQGYYFVVTGFANTHNNGTWLCSTSTTTTITLLNTDVLATGGVSGATATATFQNPVQIGIHGGSIDNAITNTGTRPPSNVTGPLQWIQDSTPGDKSDFAHQPLVLTGNILAVAHVTLAAKTDAGTRQIAQICESTGTEEIGSTVSLSNSLVYYQDILETDPHTSAAWTLSGYNAATFGIKEIS